MTHARYVVGFILLLLLNTNCFDYLYQNNRVLSFDLLSSFDFFFTPLPYHPILFYIVTIVVHWVVLVVSVSVRVIKLFRRGLYAFTQ